VTGCTGCLSSIFGIINILALLNSIIGDVENRRKWVDNG
jgi:hypothetical protein